MDTKHHFPFYGLGNESSVTFVSKQVWNFKPTAVISNPIRFPPYHLHCVI